jgi:hypothetical protein
VKNHSRKMFEMIGGIELGLRKLRNTKRAETVKQNKHKRAILGFKLQQLTREAKVEVERTDECQFLSKAIQQTRNPRNLAKLL